MGESNEQLQLISRLRNKGPISVLIADDEPAIRRIVCVFLKEINFSATEVTTGLELIDSALGNRPDLILTDVEMPGLSGLDAVARLRDSGLSTDTRTPIVMMSATHDRRQCMEAGADDFLRKPIVAERLFETIDRVLT
ncbi:response regulator [Fuerstiella marisgermanici]|uniref:Transcriptional activator protein CopR n=1 Tax=Fuerstiella marisgermanici TaxID=1891926 RepID=A0A1P8WQQ6_9PLAN|nr:response regulator [Fuerstiella marisgermanici]APZ96391.1 Transcriptional activator protein CopR [Fuerstiella marisgermanici]